MNEINLLKNIRNKEIFTGAICNDILKISMSINQQMIYDLHFNTYGKFDHYEIISKQLNNVAISSIIDFLPFTGNLYLSLTNTRLNIDIIRNKICEFLNKYNSYHYCNDFKILYNDVNITSMFQHIISENNNNVGMFQNEYLETQYFPIQKWYNFTGYGKKHCLILFNNSLAAIENNDVVEKMIDNTFSPRICLNIPIYDYKNQPYLKLNIINNETLFTMKEKISEIRKK